jgi:hypothetical protein
LQIGDGNGEKAVNFKQSHVNDSNQTAHKTNNPWKFHIDREGQLIDFHDIF